MNIIESIEHQLKSCKSLLRIFQDERKMYKEKQSVSIQEVMGIIEKKKQIMEIFENHHHILKQIKDTSANTPGDAHKEIVSELATVLEQLLVIDQENEKLLRQMLSTSNSTSRARTATLNTSRPRPSLQRQLPFVPGGNKSMTNSGLAATIAASIVPKNIEQVKKKAVTSTPVAEPTSVKKNNNLRLKQYSEINQLLKMNARYA